MILLRTIYWNVLQGNETGSSVASLWRTCHPRLKECFCAWRIWHGNVDCTCYKEGVPAVHKINLLIRWLQHHLFSLRLWLLNLCDLKKKKAQAKGVRWRREASDHKRWWVAIAQIFGWDFFTLSLLSASSKLRQIYPEAISGKSLWAAIINNGYHSTQEACVNQT